MHLITLRPALFGVRKRRDDTGVRECVNGFQPTIGCRIYMIKLGRALSWHVRLLGSVIDAEENALEHVDDLSDGGH